MRPHYMNDRKLALLRRNFSHKTICFINVCLDSPNKVPPQAIQPRISINILRYERFFLFLVAQDEKDKNDQKYSREKFLLTRRELADFTRKMDFPMKGNPLFEEEGGIDALVTNLPNLFFLVNGQYVPADKFILSFIRKKLWKKPTFEAFESRKSIKIQEFRKKVAIRKKLQEALAAEIPLCSHNEVGDIPMNHIFCSYAPSKQDIADKNAGLN